MIQIVDINSSELESSNKTYDPTQIKLNNKSQSCIIQFKYPYTDWLWSLPVKSMYLNTLEYCKERSEHMLSDCKDKGYNMEIRIVNIIAPLKLKYPFPQKDGFNTDYNDGTHLFGSWKSRIEQWEKLDQTAT